MHLRGKTLEELYDIEEALKEQDEATIGHYSNLIEVYKAMYRLLRVEKGEERTLNYIKEKLIEYYVKYGTYQKTSLEKNSQEAKRALREALKFNRQNPIVHYRLGFLAYQDKDYIDAFNSFEQAIRYQERNSASKYLLTELQLYYAQLYLTNSALHIAKETEQNIKQLDNKPKPLHYENSPFLPLIQRNEEELLLNAFYYQTREGKKTCSKEDCDEVLEQDNPAFVLYFADRGVTCKYLYESNEVSLSFEKGDIIAYFLLNSSKDKPVSRHMAANFLDIEADKQIVSNTFRVKMTRLKKELEKIGASHIIQQTTVNNETAYYVDETVPYILMYRVDDVALANMTL